MNILFKNIRVVEPVSGTDGNFNLWVKNGVIEKISPDDFQAEPETSIIESGGLVCSPGLFDMHVHFREPGFEYKEDIQSGIASAANGGYTGVCCMPNTSPPIDDVAVLELVKQKAAGALVDVFPSAAITQKQEGQLLTPMYELSDNGAVLFTDDGNVIESSEVMRRAFDYASSRGLLIAQHCEDTTLTEDYSANEGVISARLGLKGYPSVAEEIILSRDIVISEYCGNMRYHACHISSAGSVRLIRDAKARGLNVSCEVAPHHFILTEESLTTYNPNYKMNPPLRTSEDVKAMIEGLKDGTIDCIASDHAPHALHEKEVEFELAPNGIIGLETSLGLCISELVHKKHISLSKLIELMSVNPRKILGLPEIKISDGAQANLTIFDPDEEWAVKSGQFKSKARNTPFEGWKLKGKQKYTINNGQLIECVI